MDEFRYDGKVAVITGAGRGLGRTYALMLASRGATVVVNDAGVVVQSSDDRADPAVDVVAEIEAAGGTAVADNHDVVHEGAAVVEHAVDAFGAVDIVINNAGIGGPGMFADLDEAEFDRICDVHIRGARAVTKAAWPHLVKSGAGRVVNVASSAVFGGPGLSPYLIGKAGVFGLTRAIAPEGQPFGINVNSVMPIAFTRMTDGLPDESLRDFLAENFQPERIAPFVAWLVHESTDVTGECFSVAGGRAARVFLAEAPGVWIPEGGTPEQWSEHVDALLDIEGFEVPTSFFDALMIGARRASGTDLASTTVDFAEQARSR